MFPDFVIYDEDEILRLRRESGTIDDSSNTIFLLNLKMIYGDERILFPQNNSLKSIMLAASVKFEDGFERIFVEHLRQQKTVKKLYISKISLKGYHILLLKNPICSSLTTLTLNRVQLDDREQLFLVKALNSRKPFQNLRFTFLNDLKNRLILSNLYNVENLVLTYIWPSIIDGWIFSRSFNPNTSKLIQVEVNDCNEDSFSLLRPVMSQLNLLPTCKVKLKLFSIGQTYTTKEKRFIEYIRDSLM